MHCPNEIIDNIYSEPIPIFENLKLLSTWFNETVANINDYFKLKAKPFPKLEQLTFYTIKEKDKNLRDLIGGLKDFFFDKFVFRM